MKNIVIINPNLAVQKSDMMTTGIVYMPIILASFAATLRSNGYACTVIDAFGSKPNQWWDEDGFIFRGITPAQISAIVPQNTKCLCLLAGAIASFSPLISILRHFRKTSSPIPILILENAQAVTAYSLRHVQKILCDEGADYIVTGDLEKNGLALLNALDNQNGKVEANKLEGIGYRRDDVDYFNPDETPLSDLDMLPFPAWDLFPLTNYWNLHYAHGPQSARKYLPLLTSRGCPYNCGFCVTTDTNHRKWRARSARNVVDEMEYWVHSAGVREFHVEDLNPTVNDDRTRQICEEIIGRRLDITWKICAGTKAETIKTVSTLELMAKSGCRYISISPESGSAKVMQSIGKVFDIEHSIMLIRAMSRLHIRSQACFILGYPGEDDHDRKQTGDLIDRFIKEGLDEIAVFIIAPLPGSKIFDSLSGYANMSQLTFSPSWREDYCKLSNCRMHLYRRFIAGKLMMHPFKIFRQIANFLTRRFETKMEMVPYRALHTFFIVNRIVGTRAVLRSGKV